MKFSTCFFSFLLAMKIKMIMKAGLFQNRSKTRKDGVKDLIMNIAVTFILISGIC